MPEEKIVVLVCVKCGRQDSVFSDSGEDIPEDWSLVYPIPCLSCGGERHVIPKAPDLTNVVEDHSTVAWENNRFFNSKTGVTHSEEHTEKLVNVEPFQGPVAYVKRGYGLTLNLGDYEAARFDVSITVPCYMADVDAADRWAEKWAEKRIAKEVGQIRGSKDKKPPKGPAF